MKSATNEQTADTLIALLAASSIRGCPVRASQRRVDADRGGVVVSVLYSVEVVCAAPRSGCTVARTIYAEDIATTVAADVVAGMTREMAARGAATRGAIRRERSH